MGANHQKSQFHIDITHSVILSVKGILPGILDPPPAVSANTGELRDSEHRFIERFHSPIPMSFSYIGDFVMQVVNYISTKYLSEQTISIIFNLVID